MATGPLRGRPLDAVHALAAEGDGTILDDDPGRWLPHPARRRGVDVWTVDLGAGPATRSVACRVGDVWRVGDVVWRRLSWQPQPERDDLVAVDRILPSFYGELGERATVDGGMLLLRGSYAPPAGRVGAAMDAAALHLVAQHTAERFLADIAARAGDAAPQQGSDAPTAVSRARRRP